MPTRYRATDLLVSVRISVELLGRPYVCPCWLWWSCFGPHLARGLHASWWCGGKVMPAMSTDSLASVAGTMSMGRAGRSHPVCPRARGRRELQIQKAAFRLSWACVCCRWPRGQSVSCCAQHSVACKSLLLSSSFFIFIYMQRSYFPFSQESSSFPWLCTDSLSCMLCKVLVALASSNLVFKDPSL